MDPIVVEHLDHSYGEGENRSRAIFDVSLRIERGSLTALMGASGSGKTTLLTLMGCLRQVQSGSVQLLSNELRGADEHVLVTLRRQLGFIFQAHNLHDSLTAKQNVLMGLQVHGRGDPSKQERAATHLLDLLGLDDRLDYLPRNLSGGQKQRVAVARALVSNPQVVFADEPTAALDAKTGRDVVSMLKRMGTQRGTTTVLVTHDTRILDMADRIVRLEDGAIVEDSNADRAPRD